ncbi:hypothetical protein, partial [Gilliamella apicola]|uniref:hypothetical protein n=1 Tax=Gilliamella apicola TaxID=1196095 RepID=UPI001C500174
VYDSNNQDSRDLINNCANRINFLILSHLDSHYRKVIYETDYSCLAAKVFNGLSFISSIANFFMGRLKIAIKNEIKIVVIWLYPIYYCTCDS